MRRLCMRAFRLLWANLSLSMISVHLCHGPMRGPCESFMHQPVLCWMGQCEFIAPIFWRRKWAHARILHNGFQAAVGQIELISNILHSHREPMQGNCQNIVGQEVGPCESFVRQPVLCWMGQCKLISQIFWCRKWAHARTLHKGFETAMGQLELISNIRAFNPCGPIQLYFPAAVPLQAHARVSCGSPLRAG